MFKLIIKRIALMFPLLIVVSFMTFMMTYLTNEDPAVTILHAQGTPNVTPQLIAETKESMGSMHRFLFNIRIGCNKPFSLNLGRVILQAIQYQNVSDLHL